MTDLPDVSTPAPSVPVSFDGEIYKSVGKYARSAVLFAFESMGGPEALAKWGEDNQDEFYTKLFPKIIARESEVTHHKTVDQLMDVIDGDYVIEGEEIPVPDVTDKIPADFGQGQVIPHRIDPIAPNWNATDYDYENDEILRVAGEVDESVETDPTDPYELMDFEE